MLLSQRDNSIRYTTEQTRYFGLSQAVSESAFCLSAIQTLTPDCSDCPPQRIRPSDSRPVLEDFEIPSGGATLDIDATAEVAPHGNHIQRRITLTPRSGLEIGFSVGTAEQPPARVMLSRSIGGMRLCCIPSGQPILVAGALESRNDASGSRFRGISSRDSSRRGARARAPKPESLGTSAFRDR